MDSNKIPPQPAKLPLANTNNNDDIINNTDNNTTTNNNKNMKNNDTNTADDKDSRKKCEQYKIKEENDKLVDEKGKEDKEVEGDDDEDQDKPQTLKKCVGERVRVGRRESIFYRSSFGENDLSPLSVSRKVSLASETLPEEQLITPFAQILQSLKYARQNYVLLSENCLLGNEKFSNKGTGNKSNTELTEAEAAKMTSDTLEDLDWSIRQLEKVHARRSVSDMTTIKFKRILSKELTQFSETGSSASEVSEFINTTFLDDKNKDFLETTSESEGISGVESSSSSGHVTIKQDGELFPFPTTNKPRGFTKRKNSAPPFANVCENLTWAVKRKAKQPLIKMVDLKDAKFDLLSSYWSKLGHMKEGDADDELVDKGEDKSNFERSVDDSHCEELFELLKDVDDWCFDVFHFSELTNHSPILFLTSYIFHKNSWLDVLKTPPCTLFNFLNSVEHSYNSSNPYHNKLHGADVVQAAYALLMKPALKNLLSPMELIATLLAACVHDVDHPGVSNQFLVNSETDMALLYNDRSILENHHASVAFTIMRHPACNVLINVPSGVYKAVRRMIIDMVLATDMSLHVKLVADLRTAIETQKVINVSQRRQLIQQQLQIQHQQQLKIQQQLTEPQHLHIQQQQQLQQPPKIQQTTATPQDSSFKNTIPLNETKGLLDLDNVEDTIQMLKTLLHCADLGNPTRSLSLYTRWVDRIMGEFTKQGDMEREKGLDVSPMCGREVDVGKAQVGFIDYIVLPLWEAWDELMGNQCGFSLDNLSSNRDYYDKMEGGDDDGGNRAGDDGNHGDDGNRVCDDNGENRGGGDDGGDERSNE